MERLQELIQRTETIQKVNALQQNVAKQLFTYPVLGKRKDQAAYQKISAFSADTARGSVLLAQCAACQRTVGNLQRYPQTM